MINNKILLLSAFALLLNSCNKTQDDITIPVSTSSIYEGFVENVVSPAYNDLNVKSEQLKIAIYNLKDATTEHNLNEAKKYWYETREIWEFSEAWLLGPVIDYDIDSKVDAWPINHGDLQNLLNNAAYFSNNNKIDNLDNGLKGFHAIEFLLFGENKSKKAVEFTSNEKEYLNYIGQLLYDQTSKLKDSFNVYKINFLNVGKPGSIFKNDYDVLVIMIESMIGICEELVDQKMDVPISEYLMDNSKNPEDYEESRYSNNSLKDFKNNILGIKQFYKGQYGYQFKKGESLNSLINSFNISLDNKILTKIDMIINSISSIENISYGEAVKTKLFLVRKIQNLIKDLSDILKNELLEGLIKKSFLQ